MMSFIKATLVGITLLVTVSSTSKRPLYKAPVSNADKIEVVTIPAEFKQYEVSTAPLRIYLHKLDQLDTLYKKSNLTDDETKQEETDYTPVNH